LLKGEKMSRRIKKLKQFDALSQEEKQKFVAYWLVRMNDNIMITIIQAVLILSIFMAVGLICILDIRMILAGVFIACISFGFSLALEKRKERTQKYLQLAFGTNNSFEGFMDIKKSDIDNLIRGWIKK